MRLDIQEFRVFKPFKILQNKYLCFLIVCLKNSIFAKILAQMTNKYFLLFGFLFLFQSFYGQIEKINLDKKSFKELNNLYFDNEDDKELQLRIAEKYVKKARIEQSKIYIARGYYLYSLLDRLRNKEKSISYLDSVIKYSYNSNDKYYPIAAYNEKAYLYTQLSNYEATIDNYLKAEKYAKKKNNLDAYYEVRYQIAVFKSEDLGEIEEALELYLECKNYYQKKDTKDEYYERPYQRILFAIADVYKTQNKLDSASYYNKMGYKEANTTGNQKMKYLFVLNEGATHLLKGYYNEALDSVNKAYDVIRKNDDIIGELACYYYIGKCYEELKKEDLAVDYYKKVDSLYNLNNYITPEFVSGYHYLVSYYKAKDDKTNQLLYLNKILKIENTLQKGYKNWNKLLKDKYDIPHKVEEKENIISELKSGKRFNYFIMFILLIVVVFTLFFGIRQSRLKKTYKERFENLVNKTDEEIDANKSSTIATNDNIGISNEIVETILKELKNFEKNKDYLNSNITIQNLAQKLNTNSKYLSIVINAKKQKSFTQYVNDLRIDNMVNELKINKSIRKYTITAIAEEAGFNTAESFSKAFYKRTGLKPSYFIKELQEL